ncbi:IS3 family transposase [Parasegetibacter sp. NRK P23]|uniref:IS3 family transposase n=1 Tax=Parasegetibacter sp. NRK P23 TaxID=2942999 RepID=UPI0020431C8F|nr:IS3 family transposase [Parasegetibacter sp. NRK P23]MCM5530532.1 IS3 family transposase [Parasegetibacter sp. NRK P23]
MLRWTGISKSSYYYKRSTGRRGRLPSTHTNLLDGSTIGNNSVVIAIKFMLGMEFSDYGYRIMTSYLRLEGFIINAKKVYRLMGEQGLLYNSKIQVHSANRKFVQYYTQQADAPMQQLCMDIKYLYIHGAGRNALLLTVLDVYSRKILGQLLGWRMRKEQVRWLLSQVLQKQPANGITLRNDNGSQFIANMVRDYLKDQGVSQEFTHVATPEENAFIEAYHSIVERTIERRYQFESIYDAGLVMYRWKEHYNDRRLHGSLGKKTPQQVWDDYYVGFDPLRQPSAAKPEAGQICRK